MEVRIETFPDRLAVCGRRPGPYSGVGETFRRMYAWAGPAGILNRARVVMGLSYDIPEISARLRCLL
jgi:DNA gyrase inhibitor GyrI